MVRLSNWNGNARCPTWFFFSSMNRVRTQMKCHSRATEKMWCIWVWSRRARVPRFRSMISSVCEHHDVKIRTVTKNMNVRWIRVEHASRESKPISTNTRITGIKTHIVYLVAVCFFSLSSSPSLIRQRKTLACDRGNRAVWPCMCWLPYFQSKDIRFSFSFAFISCCSVRILCRVNDSLYTIPCDASWCVLAFVFFFTTFTRSLSLSLPIVCCAKNRSVRILLYAIAKSRSLSHTAAVANACVCTWRPNGLSLVHCVMRLTQTISMNLP